jgi:putative protease
MMDELEGLANRGYTEGFYRRHPPGKNRFEKGDQMELVTPSGNLSFELPEIIGRDGNTTDVAPGSGHVVKIPLPEETVADMIDEYALLVRYLPR